MVRESPRCIYTTLYRLFWNIPFSFSFLWTLSMKPNIFANFFWVFSCLLKYFAKFIGSKRYIVLDKFLTLTFSYQQIW